jgi:hypothetical protein
LRKKYERLSRKEEENIKGLSDNKIDDILSKFPNMKPFPIHKSTSLDRKLKPLPRKQKVLELSDNVGAWEDMQD